MFAIFLIRDLRSAEKSGQTLNLILFDLFVTAKKNCLENINQRHRISIWTYWQLSTYNSRKLFMCEQLEGKSTKRANQSTRSDFVSYFLKSSAGIRAQVCKDFFWPHLATLEKVV